jgi:choline dehydrogenase-like flavoprotein
MDDIDSNQFYDVIIIGSGFGGSLASHSFAKAGLNTLLLEKGARLYRKAENWIPQSIYVNQRYASDSPIAVKQDGKKNYQRVYSYEILGGMSVFFGGTALRMRETDFDKWPITYHEIEPYYTQAEELLKVCGESPGGPFDPYRSKNCLLATFPLTKPAKRIYDAAKKLGYKPFKLPLAINFKDGQRPTCIKCNACDSFPCKIQAKNDLTTTVLKQAQDYNLEIRTGVFAKRLVETDGEIKIIECINKNTGESFCLASKIVVLSGGALHSPALLMRSNLHKFRNYRNVGRYLMRHCNAVVCALFPYKTNPEQTFHKQVCITDFYEDLRQQLDTSVGVIQDIQTSSEVLKCFAPRGLKKTSVALAEFTQNLICIAEDDPNFNNCVTLSGQVDTNGMQTITIDHKYTKNDYHRRNYLINKAKGILKEAGGLLFHIHKIKTLSHAMGTVRFGGKPETSVLDRYCRFFDIKNLFVVDASFFPTSSGVNPSLTIAANSLRVADYIISNFSQHCAC